MKYVVKAGAKAFLGNSMRSAGYVHQVEKPYPSWPAWAEPEGAQVSAPKKSKGKGGKTAEMDDKKAADSRIDEVSFLEEDLLENPTVTL